MKCSYCNFKSLSWWSGAGMVGMGTAMLAGLNHPAFGQVADLLNLMTGNAGVAPALLIFNGLGVIGIRAKQERMSP